MTLKESIESGLPYQRPGMNHWLDNSSEYVFSVEDVLSNEWTLKREPIVFECEWGLTDGGEVMPFDSGAPIYETLLLLDGKRTRVTVEILE